MGRSVSVMCTVSSLCRVEGWPMGGRFEERLGVCSHVGHGPGGVYWAGTGEDSNVMLGRCVQLPGGCQHPQRREPN